MKKFSRANGRHFSLAKVSLFGREYKQSFGQVFPLIFYFSFFGLSLDVTDIPQVYTSIAVMAYVLSGVVDDVILDNS